MKIGYLIGCLFSILFYKFDRSRYWLKINGVIKKAVNDIILVQILYMSVICIITYLLADLGESEIVDGIVLFIVIDISYTEKKILDRGCRDKRKKFYKSISVISKSFIEGFAAPLIYIMCFGNWAGIGYFMTVMVSKDKECTVFSFVLKILSIIPSLAGCFILYIIYIARCRTWRINFKGDFLHNVVNNPLLNIYIMAAYIESVNFYYVEEREVHYLKSYGAFKGKIDDMCVKNYVSIIYGVSFVIFLLFWIVESIFKLKGWS